MIRRARRDGREARGNEERERIEKGSRERINYSRRTSKMDSTINTLSDVCLRNVVKNLNWAHIIAWGFFWGQTS